MKWLTRLKSEKGLPSELPKLPKASTPSPKPVPEPSKDPFDSFGSTEDRHIPENEPSAPRPRPYLDEDGDPVIPFDSDPKYHWWANGQSVEETIREITEVKERP